ncbi:MAG: Motility protein B [Syntrophus sp. SKADARSKE-3]|nr:Motility protein B [Syntrophus sp. SKADARSKE-3]
MKRGPGRRGDAKGRSWLMSFNDLLTIMLTFFILMVSLSSINISKMKSASDAANKVFNQVGTEGAIDIKTADALNRIEGLNARTEKNGVRVSLKESMLYEKGSDVLQSSAVRVLHDLAGVLRQTDASIRVEGHTDNVAIKTSKFPSNWELAAARATAVVKYLSEKEGVPAGKLSAAGYADSRPLASNQTEDGRAQNRRTEIILLFQEGPWQRKTK